MKTRMKQWKRWAAVLMALCLALPVLQVQAKEDTSQQVPEIEAAEETDSMQSEESVDEEPQGDSSVQIESVEKTDSKDNVEEIAEFTEIISSEVQFASGKTALEAPMNLRWEGAGTARWDTVSNADYYEIALRLYKQPDGKEGEKGVGYTQFVTEELDVATASSTSVDLQDKMNRLLSQNNLVAPEAAFSFRVKATAGTSNAAYSDSEYSTESGVHEFNPAGLVLLSRPKNVKLTDETVLSWDAVEGVGFYAVMVDAYDRDGNFFYSSWDTTSELSFDFSSSFTEQLMYQGSYWEEERWRYPVTIQPRIQAYPADGDATRISKYGSDTLPKQTFSIQTPVQLSAPEVSWNEESDSPVLEIVNHSDANQFLYTISFYVSTDDGKTYQKTDNPDYIYANANEEVTYYYYTGWSLYYYCRNQAFDNNTRLKVYTEVSAAYNYSWVTASPYNSTSTKSKPVSWTYTETETFDAPTNPAWKKDSYIATWDGVEGADYYEIVLLRDYEWEDEESWYEVRSYYLNPEEWNEDGAVWPKELSFDLTERVRELYLQDSVGNWSETYAYKYRFRVNAYKYQAYENRKGQSVMSPTVYYYPNGKLDKVEMATQKNAIRLWESKSLGINVSPNTIAYGRARWSVDQPEKAYIDEYGRIYGHQTGVINVTVKIGELSDTIPVTIYEINTEDIKGDQDSVADKGSDIIDEAINNPGVAPKDTEDFDWDRFWKAMEDPEHGFDIGVEQDTVAKPKVDAAKWMRDQNSKWKGGVLATFNIRVGMGPEDARFCYLTRFNEPVGFDVPVPKNLTPVADGKKRDFYLLRNHNGQITKIPVIKEKDGHYRAYSDRFSEFTLVYEDTAAATDTATGTWKKSKNGWWFSYKKGGYPASKWERIDGEWYYFDAKGYMQTGWKRISGKWYYFSGSGDMQTGWVKSSGKWYYLKPNGAMSTGWEKVGTTWYYMNTSGAMQTGWLKSGKTWYYLNKDGSMATGWVKSGGKWYYMNGSGVMQTGWEKVGGKWYYLNGGGDMVTGWKKDKGKWYYLESSGAMLSNTFRKIGSKTYNFDSSGVCTNP